jgi:hypothetical protein
MQRTVWLTGMLPSVLLVSAALTAPLALLALWLYRRAVLRSMALAAGAPPPEAELTASSRRARRSPSMPWACPFPHPPATPIVAVAARCADWRWSTCSRGSLTRACSPPRG